MAELPPEISTALVHMDAPLSFIGEPGRLHVEILPSVSLVWAATGTPVVNFEDMMDLADGQALEIQLPHTDQDGFLDGAGNTITGWYYTVKITYEKDGQLRVFPERDFQVLVGQDDVDLALVPAGEAAVPMVAPILTVTSIEGFTGAVTKTQLGIERVNNTNDAEKPISTAAQAALDLKAPKANPTFTGTVSGITKSMVGLGSVDNTSDAAKPVSTAQQAALDAKLDDAQLGAASGVAPLGADSKVPETHIPTRLSTASLTAAVEDQVFPLAVGVPAGTDPGVIPVLRTVGDGKTAVWEYIQNGGGGYLWHLMQGAASTSGDWVFGIGVDAGAGNGILIRNKSLGIGQRIEQTDQIDSATAYGLHISQDSMAPGVYMETRPTGLAPLLTMTSFQTDQNVKMLAINAAQGAAGDVNGYSGLLQWFKNADVIGGTLNVRHSNGVAAAARKHIKLEGVNGMTWHSPSGTDNQWWPFRINTGGSNFNIQAAGLSGTPDAATFTTVIGIKNAQLGFFGVTPASRPAAIASPTADSASLKTAVDAIRAALTTLGLTS